MKVTFAMVRDPAAVRITVVTDENRAEFRLAVAPDDLGAVIGSKGRTARALRTLIGAISVKQGQRFALVIEDANGEDDGTEL